MTLHTLTSKLKLKGGYSLSLKGVLPKHEGESMRKRSEIKEELDWGDEDETQSLEQVKKATVIFEPTQEQIMFKSFITQLLGLEDLMDLVRNPREMCHKFRFFDVNVVEKWCENVLFCSWLCIENFSGVYLETKHLDYIRDIERIAEDNGGLDPKTSQIKLAAYKILLEERRHSKPQSKVSQEKDLQAQLKAVPKTLAKLSAFELATEVKSLESLSSKSND